MFSISCPGPALLALTSFSAVCSQGCFLREQYEAFMKTITRDGIWRLAKVRVKQENAEHGTVPSTDCVAGYGHGKFGIPGMGVQLSS